MSVHECASSSHITFDAVAADVVIAVSTANNHAYDEAAKLAGTIRELMSQTGGEAAFTGWITELKAKHRAKRNFVKRLDSLRVL